MEEDALREAVPLEERRTEEEELLPEYVGLPPLLLTVPLPADERTDPLPEDERTEPEFREEERAEPAPTEERTEPLPADERTEPELREDTALPLPRALTVAVTFSLARAVRTAPDLVTVPVLLTGDVLLEAYTSLSPSTLRPEDPPTMSVPLGERPPPVPHATELMRCILPPYPYHPP